MARRAPIAASAAIEPRRLRRFLAGYSLPMVAGSPLLTRKAPRVAPTAYVPLACQTGGQRSGVRLPAKRFEAGLRRVLERVARAGEDPLSLSFRIELHPDRMVIELAASKRPCLMPRLSPDKLVETGADGSIRWSMSWTAPRRGFEIVGQCRGQARRDPVLIKALRSAHAMLNHDHRGRPLLSKVPGPRYERRLARLALLSPKIQAAIIEGRQPAGLTLELLVRNPMPLCWQEQERWLRKLAAR